MATKAAGDTGAWSATSTANMPPCEKPAITTCSSDRPASAATAAVHSKIRVRASTNPAGVSPKSSAMRPECASEITRMRSSGHQA